ncbi:MAG: arsenic resistance protein [Nitrososphaerota archaeon]|nr:arsenic resistance protein [Nitrososphaerota archaeon]
MTPANAHHESTLHLISEHVRKYLILYTVLSAGIAIPVGYYSSAFTAANKQLISNLVIFFAILTIYPSMIQLKTEGLANSFRSWKSILVSLIYVFVLSPVIAFALAPTFGSSEIGLGFVTANIVPASSASLGYVLIAGGSIELATALAVLSLVIAIPAIPFFMSLYSSQVSATVPIFPVLTSVVYILVLPFIAGQLTRYPILRMKGSSFVNKSIKPYLSLATMLSMFALIFVLVAKEASVMIAKPQLVGYIIGFQSTIIVGILIVSIVVSRAMHLSYEDHQAVAFISVTKNQSVAAAIATMALNPVSALAPAIIPMIQPVLAVIYINLEKPIREMFERPPSKITKHIETTQGNK